MVNQTAPMSAEEIDSTLEQMAEDGYNVETKVLRNGSDATAAVLVGAYDAVAELFPENLVVQPVEIVTTLAEGLGEIAGDIADMDAAAEDGDRESIVAAAAMLQKNLITLAASAANFYDAVRGLEIEEVAA